jgi:hypothetical protein
MTRINLDELVLLARVATALGSRWYTAERLDQLDIRPGYAEHIAANSPQVTLTLVARIRELEAAVQRAVGYLQAGSDKAARREWAAGLLEDLAKGAVLP